MKIQILNHHKLKIIFNIKDLEENNISLHSFLAGSKKSIDFLKAAIEIAHEDFNFYIDNQNFSYETFCFDYSEFIIIVSPKNNFNSSIDFTSITSNTLTENISRENDVSAKLSFNFLDNQLSNTIFNKKDIYYLFTNLEDFFEFSNYAKDFFKYFKVKSYLYEYKNIFLLEILIDNLSCFELEKMFLFFSEIKTSSSSSELAITRFKEFSKLIMSDNALNL